MKLYLVMEHTGDRDDHWQHVSYASLDPEKAIAHKATMKELFALGEKVREHMASLMRGFDEQHPRPNMSSWRDTPLPPELQGRPKKTWSDEEKAFAASLKQTNELGRQASAKPYGEWATMRYQHSEDLKAELTPRERFAFSIDSTASWELDELELDDELRFA